MYTSGFLVVINLANVNDELIVHMKRRGCFLHRHFHSNVEVTRYRTA